MKKYKDISMVPVQVNMNACDGCGICATICPTHALEMREITNEEVKDLSFFGRLKVRIKGNIKSEVANPDACIECGKCARNCHEHAIAVTNLREIA